MKVVKLLFKETGQEHFFTSYSAMYDLFTHEEIGAVIGTVWNGTSKHKRYENDKVLIKSYPLRAKKRSNA